MLDKKAVREVARKYADKVLQEFKPDKIILFGSYVNGTPHEWSDIDIAVVIHSFEGEWLKSVSRLHRLTWDFDEIIEPHLLDPTYDPSGFAEHIIKTGEIIYQSA